MKVALVGFRGSGKTSVFNALTGQSADTGLGKKSANLGRIMVPDERVAALSAIYRPRKTTYAEIAFVDVPGPEEGASNKGLDAALVAQIREAEALVHVVRAFDNPAIAKGPDPAKDIQAFEDELILTDLVQIEKRVRRLEKEKKGPEYELLERLMKDLESGRAFRRQKLDEGVLQAVAGFAFLSLKPVLVVLNQAEGDHGKVPDAVKAVAKENELELVALSAPMEAEIMAMEPDDQKAFLEDLGLSEPMRTRFIHAAYRLLDLISFLTVGEDEVRAWTIRRGTNARAASGKIHTDLEHGFIRAEVTPSADFLALGSESKVKEAGKLRLEGKDYIVHDGDIMHVRHSG